MISYMISYSATFQMSVAAGATMNIESSHGRSDPRRQFLGLATDPTRQDSIPLVVAGSWCCHCQCSSTGGARTDSIQQRPLLNRLPFVLGFIQDRKFCFTCKMECTQYHSEGFTAISGARLPFNKTKETNGPVTPAHIENWIALVTAEHHRSKDHKIWQTRISQGKSRWWHRKISHGKSRWWHRKTSHGKSRWWHRKASHGKYRWWHRKTSHGKSRWCSSKEKQKKAKNRSKRIEWHKRLRKWFEVLTSGEAFRRMQNSVYKCENSMYCQWIHASESSSNQSSSSSEQSSET